MDTGVEAPTATAKGRSSEAIDSRAHGSWLDRLFRRVASLPFGGWWVYLVLLLAMASWATIVRWATGVAPPGEVDLSVLTFTVFLPYGLVFMHYLDVVAERSLTTFSPAIGGSDQDLAYWRRELTSLPSRPATLTALGGALFAVFLLATTPPNIYTLFSNDLLTTTALVGWLIVPSFAVSFALVYHTWHQLRAVRAIHAAAARIDLFRPAPLFAFSGLTARTGLGYLLILYFSLAINGQFSDATPALAINVLYGAFALACFVLPLWGIHGRLVAAKTALLDESDARIQVARDELHRLLDSAELTGAGNVGDALRGLISIRELIVRLQTWPWSTQLLGGFITALLLPILIWFITRALATVLNV